MSGPEAEEEEEFLLPLREPPAHDAVVPEKVPDNWLEQPQFDSLGRPI